MCVCVGFQDLAQCVNEVKRDNEIIRQITTFQMSIEHLVSTVFTFDCTLFFFFVLFFFHSGHLGSSLFIRLSLWLSMVAQRLMGSSRSPTQRKGLSRTGVCCLCLSVVSIWSTLLLDAVLGCLSGTASCLIKL